MKDDSERRGTTLQLKDDNDYIGVETHTKAEF